MDKFLELVSLCKASIAVDVNDHKSCYESVSDYVADDADEIDSAVLAEMIKRDTVFRIQAYPNTPIGFFVVYHYDFGIAVDMALEIIKSFL